ncbi:MAG: hypothetical protein LBP67_05555 [Bacteroidales bacterium]|jgi:hypothetical protein|nr:hypothetical protein [Bacteroidales bacterium]
MKKFFHKILSFTIIVLLLVFSSGIHIFIHHCLIADETEIVFNAKQISCDHHETIEDSCCGHQHENGCCETQEENHNCSHSHYTCVNNNEPFDDVSFSPITCEVNEFDLILDKNNISQSPTFDLEKEFVLLKNNYFCEIIFNNPHFYKDIHLTKFLYPDEQPVLFTGIESVYLFHCPKIPHNYYC